MEHIFDLQKVVKNLLEWLKPDGLIYIEVPDASRYYEFYKVPYHYFDIEHINHFDENSLKNLLLQFKCECIKWGKKTIPVSDVDLYPAVYIIIKKIKVKKYDIIPNFNVKENVLKYIDMSYNDKKISNKIEEIYKSEKEIVIWGAGSYTTRLLKNTLLGKCNIISFIDNDHKKQGGKIQGVEILSPKILKKFKGLIVISSALFSHEILNEIKTMGLKNKTIILK